MRRSRASPRSGTAKAPCAGALAGHLRRPGRRLYWAPAAARLRRHDHESRRRARGRLDRVALRVLPRQGRDRRAGGRAAGRARAAPAREAGAARARGAGGRRAPRLARADPRDGGARARALRRLHLPGAVHEPHRRDPAVSSRLLDFSQQVRRRAGGLVRQEISPATMRLIVNLVSSTIMQLVLDPPADVTKRRAARRARPPHRGLDSLAARGNNPA